MRDVLCKTGKKREKPNGELSAEQNAERTMKNKDMPKYIVP
jgi:hypothetical protein